MPYADSRGFARSAPFPAGRLARRRLSAAPRRRVPRRSRTISRGTPFSDDFRLPPPPRASPRRVASPRTPRRTSAARPLRSTRLRWRPPPRRLPTARTTRRSRPLPPESAPARRHHETGSPGTAAAATTLPIFFTPPASARARRRARTLEEMRASRRADEKSTPVASRGGGGDATRLGVIQRVRFARVRARPRARVEEERATVVRADDDEPRVSRDVDGGDDGGERAGRAAPAVPAPTSARQHVQSSAPYTTDASPSRATHVTKVFVPARRRPRGGIRTRR